MIRYGYTFSFFQGEYFLLFFCACASAIGQTARGVGDGNMMAGRRTFIWLCVKSDVE